MKYLTGATLIFFFLFLNFTGHAQAIAQIPVMASAGGAGNVNEGSGAVDFTVGQVFFINDQNNDFAVNQGIQQPSNNNFASKVEDLLCAGSILDDTLVYSGELYNGVIILPYLKGNGASFQGFSVQSEQVAGLTLTLQSGKLVKGNGAIELLVTGKPAGNGIAVFPLSFGSKTCNVSIKVIPLPPKLNLLDCNSIMVDPMAIGSKLDYSGIVKVKYSGGNNRRAEPFTLNSLGVKGLLLQSDSTLLERDGGTILMKLSGKPDSSGYAFFPFSIGEKTCNLYLKVINSELFVPNVFTPNGDGKNDYWEIPALIFKAESMVLIFDRFGRLLVEYPGSTRGWNGLIGGIPASAGDYWYVIKLQDDQIVKGNFTLIR